MFSSEEMHNWRNLNAFIALFLQSSQIFDDKPKTNSD